MRDQQPAIDEVNIRFDAAKSTGQCVQQRPGVFVFVMRVGADEGRRIDLCSCLYVGKNREQQEDAEGAHKRGGSRVHGS